MAVVAALVVIGGCRLASGMEHHERLSGTYYPSDWAGSNLGAAVARFASEEDLVINRDPFSTAEILDGDSADADGSGYARSRDWRGLGRDTAYFIGYQFAVIGILYVLPESVTNWSAEAKDDYSFNRWKENASNPVLDEDDWFINYVLHPYWGASYYVRARQRGLSGFGSFWYSTALSTIYEFGLEALFEPASVQDTFVTPIVGSLLGEYFIHVREKVAAATVTEPITRSQRLALVLTDPLGALNRKTDQVFGRETHLTFSSFSRSMASYTGPRLPYQEKAGTEVGVQLKLTF